MAQNVTSRHSGAKRAMRFGAVAVITGAMLVAQANASEDLCNDGKLSAESGDYRAALSAWGELAYDETPKERLRTVLECLKETHITVDNVDSAQWIVSAAESGLVNAQEFAGMLYASGVGVSRSFSDARMWLERAARGGSQTAPALLDALNDVENAQ